MQKPPQREAAAWLSPACHGGTHQAVAARAYFPADLAFERAGTSIERILQALDQLAISEDSLQGTVHLETRFFEPSDEAGPFLAALLENLQTLSWIVLPRQSPLVGQRLRMVEALNCGDARVAAIFRKGELVLHPSEDAPICQDDALVIMRRSVRPERR